MYGNIGDGCHVDTCIMPHRIGVPNGQKSVCLIGTALANATVTQMLRR